MVGPQHMAGPALVRGVVREGIARSDTAGPAFAFGIKAKLIRRWRVDAGQTNMAVADLNAVAIADLRRSADISGVCVGRQEKQGQGREKFHDHAKGRILSRFANIQDPELWCGLGGRTSTLVQHALST
jgi:hypothetical protein